MPIKNHNVVIHGLVLLNLLCCMAAMCSVCVAQEAQYSDLWGRRGEQWTPQSRLPDFSYAGYHAGEKRIPDVPVKANVKDFGAKGDGMTDDTQAFMRAIRDTTHGALFIPAGTYKIGGQLRITNANFVLRGEGENATTLLLTEPLKDTNGETPYFGGLIQIAGDTREVKLTHVIAGAKRGATRLKVASASAIQPGQMVRLRMTNPPDNSLGRQVYADLGELNEEREAWYERQIVNWAVKVRAVNGNIIELERPLRLDVRPEWNPTLWSLETTVTETGIEDLTIAFPNVQYGGHHLEAGFFGIQLYHVFDCWVRNVTIVDSDRGVEISQGGHNTITNITLKAHWREESRDPGGDGATGHYAFQATGQAQDNLFEKSRLETVFVHNLGVNAFSSGNVFSDITTVNARFDHHGAAPYENLYTDITVTSQTGDFFKCGGNREDEPNAGARATFWNIRALKNNFPSRCKTEKFPQCNIVGVDKWPTAKSKQEAWIEQWPGAQTQPSNLYKAQLKHRLNKQ